MNERTAETERKAVLLFLAQTVGRYLKVAKQYESIGKHASAERCEEKADCIEMLRAAITRGEHHEADDTACLTTSTD